jgi:ABC-type glycerol-3-phosphate transport system permease component
MTAVNSPGEFKPRSKANRRLRNLGSRASVTLFAGALCFLFVLPLIYMFSAAFNNSNTLSTSGAPLYPAINKSYVCPSDALCTYYDGFVDVTFIKYSNAPVIGSTIASVPSTTANAANSTDVSSVVTTRGVVSFAITDPSTTNPITFSSKEGSNKPQLSVSTCSSGVDKTVPSSPKDLAAVAASDTEVDLSWSASTDDTGVAGYNVFRDADLIASVGSTSWSDLGLAAGSSHSYTVDAFDAALNESVQAPAVKVTLKAASGTAPAKDTVAPSAPSNVAASASAWNAVKLTWAVSTDNVAVTMYSILRDGNIVAKVSGSTKSFTDVTTAFSTKYAYTITASDAAGNTSDPSNSASVTTPAFAGCTKTTTNLDPVGDTYVNQAKPDTNYGTDPTLLIDGASGSVENTYLKFDLTSLPAGQITGATLSLYSQTASSTGYTVAGVSNTNWGESEWVQTTKQDLKGTALPIYTGPIVAGHGDLALLVSRSTTTQQPSIFLDPVTGDQVLAITNVDALSKSWEFHITLDNFATAEGWAQKITSGAVSDSSLGGNFGGFARFFFNTFVIAGVGTVGATLSAIIVAFGFARFRIPGRDALFLVLIGTILLPFQVILIPQFIIFNAIGWSGTWLPLIVPHYFSNAYNVFLLRQYFLTLPRELDEAAMMDGASPFRILISVIIPQSWPAIAAVMLFHFFFAWNDFLGPLIYLTGKPDLYPIAIGLNYFNTTFRVANAPAAIQAGALISLVLPVAIFFVAQRVFMRGVVISGVEK